VSSVDDSVVLAEVIDPVAISSSDLYESYRIFCCWYWLTVGGVTVSVMDSGYAKEE